MIRDRKSDYKFSILTGGCLCLLLALRSLQAAVVPGPFAESGGLVVMEAEHFHTNTTASGHSWEPSTTRTGFAGEAAMQAVPDSDTSINATDPAGSPVLSYRIEFTDSGTYNLWVRGWADDDSDDSIQVGLDDQIPQDLPYGRLGAWMWRAKQVVIPGPGLHEVKIRMREDGAYVDRLLLATNLTFTPDGAGPAESPLVNALPTVQITSPTSGTSVRVGTSLTIAAEAGDSDGTIARVDFYANGNLLKTDTTAPYSLIWTPAAGLYAFTAVATDDRGAITTSSPVNMTVLGDFVETGGLAVMEAEHFETSTAGSGYSWMARTNQAGFIGDSAMQATPEDTEVAMGIQDAAAGPTLSYRVEFATAGPYNFWVRGWGAHGLQDSVYIGLDGQVLKSLPYTQVGSWMWCARPVVIPSPGTHEVQIWMREAGARVDRLLLTADPQFSPGGDGLPESSRFGGPPPPNAPPVVRINSPASGTGVPVGTSLTITTDASDRDGWIDRVVLQANGTLLDTNSIEPYSFTWTPAIGTYDLVVIATDNGGASAMSSPVRVTIKGPFVETGGLVVMEAEHYQGSTTASGHSWESNTNRAGFSGESAMQSSPDTDTSITDNIPVNSPLLSYRVDFTATGTNNFWIRGWADDDSSDSINVGLDDQVPQNLHYSRTGAWTWRAQQIVVPSPGPHDVKVWMREDGASVDRLLLTTNLSFTPEGAGPPESLRAGEIPQTNAPPTLRLTARLDGALLELSYKGDQQSELQFSHDLRGWAPLGVITNTPLISQVSTTPHISFITGESGGMAQVRLAVPQNTTIPLFFRLSQTARLDPPPASVSQPVEPRVSSRLGSQ
jgi:hypothetical protein